MVLKWCIVMLITLLPAMAFAQPTTAPAGDDGATMEPARPRVRPFRQRMGATTRPTTGPTTQGMRFRQVPRGPVTSIDEEAITISVRTRRGEAPVEQTYPLDINTRVTRASELPATTQPTVRQRVRMSTTGSAASIADIKVGQQVMLLIDEEANKLQVIVILADPTTQPGIPQ